MTAIQLTISPSKTLPEDVLRRFCALASAHDKSADEYLAEVLEDVVASQTSETSDRELRPARPA